MEYAKIVAVLYFTSASIAAQSVLRTEQFTRDAFLDNRLCNVNERVLSNTEQSVIQCARACLETQNCASTFYSKTTKQCYGCNSTYTIWSNTLSVTGMKYYVLGPVYIPEASTCFDHLVNGSTTSGVYMITTPVSHTVLPVYCDMDTEGGGWTVWQRRFDGSVDFVSRTFVEYENGFGNPSGEHWLGLKYLYEFLFARTSDVYLQFTDFNDTIVYEWFRDMRIAAAPFYNLTLAGILVSANDTTTNYGFKYNDLQPFSTQDNIQNAYTHCPAQYHGGWWYYSCTRINANGKYGAAGLGGGDYIYNMEWSMYTALKGTKLMIREL